MSALDGLCERIQGDERFQYEYSSLIKNSLGSEFLVSGNPRIEEQAMRRLVQSAAIFSQSGSPETRQLAYRIVVASLSYQDVLNGTANVARLIFSRLGNYPAIDFAFSGQPEPTSIPQTAFFEISGRRLANTVDVAGKIATLTDFQLMVWNLLKEHKSVALSAPTSAGKSYLFQSFIRYVKSIRPSDNIVYLVPSRALINQVASELSKPSESLLLPIVTVPVELSSESAITSTYVFTPERLQILLQSSPAIVFQTVIVDEAHLIGEGSRGIILQSVLQEVQRRNEQVQFLFSSPQVRDPSIFGRVVGRTNVEVVKTTDSPVAQNIVLVRGAAETPRNISLSLWNRGIESSLGEFEVSIDLLTSEDRLIYLSWYLGQKSQSLVYATGPAACETIALKIAGLMEEQPDKAKDEKKSRARQALSSFATESVHPSFLLVDTVKKGVAFHYGRIPTLLRRAIETEFDQGNLEYIVCTSTLLQGVNLPARNIFMQNPMKGDDIPIEPVDFWNLAGRAGRLGRDFEGNVFLIDYDKWDSEPLSGDKDQPIIPALELLLTLQSTEFLEYAESGDRPSGEPLDFEAAFAKLFRDFRHGRLFQTLDAIPNVSEQTRARLTAALTKANETVKIETETLDESPQISAFRQQGLYDYMIEKILEEGPNYLIPLHPNAGFTEGLAKLRPVFARVHKYIELKSQNSHIFWAPLALRWMRGEPLPRLIDGAIKYHKTRASRTVIREVLNQVENDLRFRYVKLIGCYVAVLKRALRNTGHAALAERVPALTLYLELGAASQTMISLLGLGLSRLTSWRIAELTLNREMNSAAALAFVRGLNLDRVGFSPYVISEIRQVTATQ